MRALFMPELHRDTAMGSRSGALLSQLLGFCFNLRREVAVIQMGLVCDVVEGPTFVLFAGERGGEPMRGSLLKHVQKRFAIIG